MNPNKKILVVDDNPDIRRLIHLTLTGQYEVIEAENGDTALKLLHQHMPDLVILDIMMPGGIDGLQVLETIKQSPELKQILVLMVTARGQVSDYEFGLKKGADAYFVKPFSPISLMQWVKEHLSK
jgi:CheY-like chemotaxis protein